MKKNEIMHESVYPVSGPEFTHLSLSPLSCFEFMISVNTLDETETVPEFGQCVYPSTNSVAPGNLKQFPLETLLMGTLGI